MVQVALAVEPGESSAKASRGGECCECDTTHIREALWRSFWLFLRVTGGQLARETGTQQQGAVRDKLACSQLELRCEERTCGAYLYKILRCHSVPESAIRESFCLPSQPESGRRFMV